MCCHLLVRKRCLCLALYFYLKHADLMAAPMLSINAFKAFELHVSCQPQEDGAGWRRQGLYVCLLVLSAALETHGQELQCGNLLQVCKDLLAPLESIIYQSGPLPPAVIHHSLLSRNAFSHFSPGHYFSLHEPAGPLGSGNASTLLASCLKRLTSSAAICLSTPATTHPKPSLQAEEMQSKISTDKCRGLEIVCPGGHRPVVPTDALCYLQKQVTNRPTHTPPDATSAWTCNTQTIISSENRSQ